MFAQGNPTLLTATYFFYPTLMGFLPILKSRSGKNRERHPNHGHKHINSCIRPWIIAEVSELYILQKTSQTNVPGKQISTLWFSVWKNKQKKHYLPCLFFGKHFFFLVEQTFFFSCVTKKKKKDLLVLVGITFFRVWNKKCLHRTVGII